MNRIKFGTGGFRAIIGEDFNKINVQGICQAICNIVDKKKLKKQICIGYDNRFESEYFALWCAHVFAGNGFNVELFENATTTPVVMYASLINKNPYGIMITASHNPYMYNGVKVFVNEGRDASKEETDEIEEEYKNLKKIYTDENSTRIKHANYIDSFINYIVTNQELAALNGDLKVVYDAKFGSSVEELQKLSDAIGIKNYLIINSQRDAFFDFVPPAPNKNNIEKLILNVKNSKADIGFALDADGDRIAIVDEQGNYIDNNYILAIIYYYYIKYEHKIGDCVKNCCTSNLLSVVAEKLGYNCHEVPVGFKFISSKLTETNSIIGGESSGGLAVGNHIFGKDSMLTIGLCLKILSKLKKPFSQILSEVLHFANNYSAQIYDKAYTYSKNQEQLIKTKIFDKNNPFINDLDVKDVVNTNYLKITYKNNDWVNIRFSGTEPVLRIFIESTDKNRVENMFSAWENYLNLQ